MGDDGLSGYRDNFCTSFKQKVAKRELANAQLSYNFSAQDSGARRRSFPDSLSEGEFELLEHDEASLKLDHATCTLFLKYQKIECECSMEYQHSLCSTEIHMQQAS
jgi:hypothetical protein